MAKKITKKFTATLELNPEKAGAWIANVSLVTPINIDPEAGRIQNSMMDTEAALSAVSAWKNASAAKRWIKSQVLVMTPRKSVKLEPTKIDKTTEKPTAFVGVLEFKA
jgi:hypothetical protein